MLSERLVRAHPERIREGLRRRGREWRRWRR